MGDYFLLCVFTRQDCFVVVSFFHVVALYFSVQFDSLNINIMNTYHTALWSSDPSYYSSSEEEEDRYRSLVLLFERRKLLFSSTRPPPYSLDLLQSTVYWTVKTIQLFKCMTNGPATFYNTGSCHLVYNKWDEACQM